MLVIPMPASPVPRKIAWSPGPKTQVNRSEWTDRSKTTILTGAPRWRATSVELPPIIGEPNIWAWRAWVADLEGRANAFRLIACERDQLTGVAPVVQGGGQAGNVLMTSGWGAAGLKLRRGQFITIRDQLLILMADVVADAGGFATIAFRHHLRSSPPAAAPIEVRRPWALMRMVDDDAGWAVDIGQNYAISFACREAF